MNKVSQLQKERISQRDEREKKAKSEIESAINKAIQELQDTKWEDICMNEDSKVLPKWLISSFQDAIMQIEPEKVEILPIFIFGISKRKPNEVTFGEIPIILNVFAKSKPSCFCSSIKVYEEKRRILDRISLSYKHVELNKEKELSVLEANLKSVYDAQWNKVVN